MIYPVPQNNNLNGATVIVKNVSVTKSNSGFVTTTKEIKVNNDHDKKSE